MFDNLKNMSAMAGLFKDLPRIKSKMEEVKAQLGELEVEAETGGGAVRVRANGHLHVVSIKVEPALLVGLVDPSQADDLPLAEDLIVGAVNAALARARAAVEDAMQQAAADLGIPLPPGGMGGLLG